MISTEEAIAKVSQAEKSGELSASAAAAIRRWLTESPFVQYRPKLLELTSSRAGGRFWTMPFSPSSSSAPGAGGG